MNQVQLETVQNCHSVSLFLLQYILSVNLMPELQEKHKKALTRMSVRLKVAVQTHHGRGRLRYMAAQVVSTRRPASADRTARREFQAGPIY